MSNQKEAFTLIKNLTGQANILTIPRIFVDYTGSLEAALLLSQVIYWSDKGGSGDGWFFKTYHEWRDEICLTEYAVRKAANKLTDMGILETKIKKAKGSPTVHYRLKIDIFTASLAATFQNGNCEIEGTNPPNQRMKSTEIAETITETTPQIIPKTTGETPPPNFEELAKRAITIYSDSTGVKLDRTQAGAIVTLIEETPGFSLNRWQKACTTCRLNGVKVENVACRIETYQKADGDYQVLISRRQNGGSTLAVAPKPVILDDAKRAAYEVQLAADRAAVAESTARVEDIMNGTITTGIDVNEEIRKVTRNKKF